MALSLAQEPLHWHAAGHWACVLAGCRVPSSGSLSSSPAGRRGAVEEGSVLADHMSEKGVLQMLLDVRFLRASLAEGRPRSAASSAPPAPPAAQPRQGPPRLARDGPGQQLQDWFLGLETTLQVRARLGPSQALCWSGGGRSLLDACLLACKATRV